MTSAAEELAHFITQNAETAPFTNNIWGTTPLGILRQDKMGRRNRRAQMLAFCAKRVQTRSSRQTTTQTLELTQSSGSEKLAVQLLGNCCTSRHVDSLVHVVHIFEGLRVAVHLLFPSLAAVRLCARAHLQIWSLIVQGANTNSDLIFS